MEGLKAQGADLFDALGLEVQHGDVEVGGTYPIFGMITRVVSEEPGDVVVELNFKILARLGIKESSQIETLKERVFESGIFVSKIIHKEPSLEVACRTVIFGKKQGFHA
jgi:hypothetical protein